MVGEFGQKLPCLEPYLPNVKHSSHPLLFLRLLYLYEMVSHKRILVVLGGQHWIVILGIPKLRKNGTKVRDPTDTLVHNIPVSVCIPFNLIWKFVVITCKTFLAVKLYIVLYVGCLVEKCLIPMSVFCIVSFYYINAAEHKI